MPRGKARCENLSNEALGKRIATSGRYLKLPSRARFRTIPPDRTKADGFACSHLPSRKLITVEPRRIAANQRDHDRYSAQLAINKKACRRARDGILAKIATPSKTTTMYRISRSNIPPCAKTDQIETGMARSRRHPYRTRYFRIVTAIPS